MHQWLNDTEDMVRFPNKVLDHFPLYYVDICTQLKVKKELVRWLEGMSTNIDQSRDGIRKQLWEERIVIEKLEEKGKKWFHESKIV